MPNFNSDADCLQAIASLQQMLKNERQRERNLKVRYQALKQVPQVQQSSPVSLKKNLEAILPEGLIPANVGALDSVAWPFYYQFDFDFGTDPSLLQGQTFQVQSNQVTQEAGFLLLSIGRDSLENSNAGSNGPWTIDYIRDRQSTRQFNNEPIAFQTFGNESNPSYMSTPLFFFPNAFIDIQMGTFSPTSYTAVGSAQHQITLFGYRVRMGDEQKILSTIFG